jgi:chromosome segregation ATPase
MRKYDEVQELLKCLRECSSDEAYLSRQAADEITRLTAEVTRLKAVEADYDYHEREMINLEKDNARLTARVAELEEALKKAKEALKKAKYGLDAGVKQYAARDMHGNIVPGDEQYPWVKAMQIGLDASSAALTQEKTNERI